MKRRFLHFATKEWLMEGVFLFVSRLQRIQCERLWKDAHLQASLGPGDVVSWRFVGDSVWKEKFEKKGGILFLGRFWEGRF